MLFNTAIDQLNVTAAKIEAQIEQLQNQLSQVQSQIQAVRSIEQAAESAIGQVRQAINGIRAIDPTLEKSFRNGILDQFDTSPEAFLAPVPDAPEPGDNPEPEAHTPTIEVIVEDDLEDRIIEMEMEGTILTVEPPHQVKLTEYTKEELRRVINNLSLKQPPSKASKMELIRYLDDTPDTKLRDALKAITL